MTKLQKLLQLATIDMTLQQKTDFFNLSINETINMAVNNQIKSMSEKQLKRKIKETLK